MASSGPSPVSSIMDEARSFEACEFKLDRRLSKAAARLSFVYATLVQVHCIPLALRGKDLLVRARTGSGKTAAFVLPLLQKLLHTRDANESAFTPALTAVILVPTKELVAQMANQVKELMYYCKDVITVVALGDESVEVQAALLQSLPDILIGTPGKLVAHLDAANLTLAHVTTLVVDEADLVLSYGYETDIRRIYEKLPKVCQGFFMSATLSPELNQLKRAVLHNPAIVKLEEGSGSDGHLAQFYVTLAARDKDLCLYAMLKLGLIQGKILFFTNSTENAYRLKLFFEQFSIKAAVLNAQLPFNSRQHIIEEFNRGILDYVIATDESIDRDDGTADTDEDGSDSDEEYSSAEEDDADPTASSMKKQAKNPFGVSRGVDFKGINFVVNVDVPKSVKSYIHRVGRTARGGANGTALTLVESDPDVETSEMKMLSKIQRLQDKAPAPSALGEVTDTPESLTLDTTHDVTSTSASRVVAQPAPLDFDMKEIDCFRYRVEDIRRAVTSVGVREARLNDVKKEMLNSDKLKAHFEDNPRDLNILQHDKAIGSARVQPHLAHIPSYLVPVSLQVQKKKKRTVVRKTITDKRRKLKNDPLHSFEYSNVTEDTDMTAALDEEPAPRGPKDPIPSTNGHDIGTSSSGRQRWKERHRKGNHNPNTIKKKNYKSKKGFKH